MTTSGGALVDIGTEIKPVDPIDLAWEDLNDIGNARRLQARDGGRLAYVPEWGWLANDGLRWSAEDGRRLASLAAQRIAGDMRGEIAALSAIDEAELMRQFGEWCTAEVRKNRLIDMRKWSVTSGMAAKTQAMLAQAEHLLSRQRDDFDRERLAVNVQNGTLRFFRDDAKNWRVRRDDHDPGDLLSRVTSCAYDPSATCPNFIIHMDTVLPDQPTRDFFQEVIGYGLLGLRTEQCMVMLQGKGGDGKSTAMNSIRTMMGGYAVDADVQTFIAGPQRDGGGPSPDMARLAGDTRLVLISEPRRGQALDEGRIKAFTSGGRIVVRQLNKDPFEYQPRGLIVLECNSRPRIAGDDDGIWRRILIVLFKHQFKGTEIDKRFGERLATEMPGILNWAIEGALRWLQRGRLEPPAAVIEAVDDYRRAANPFGEWFAERVDISDPNVLTLSATLFQDYKEFCEANGAGEREVMTSTKFGLALGDRQIIKGPNDRTGKVRRRGAKLYDKPKVDLWAEGDDD